jgi:hypothetical protein
MVLVSCPASPADEITFANGEARLSGELRAIDAAGVAELASPLSPEPLRIANGSIRSIRFSHPAPPSPDTDCQISLRNGDVMVGTLRAFDGRFLTLDSPSLGVIRAGREHVHSLQFGGAAPATLYQGPNSTKEWSSPDSKAGTLKLSGGRLGASGRARAQLDAKLPEDFMIEFRLHWNKTPQFRVFFADPLDNSGNATDRYYIQFNAAGSEVKREASEGRRWTTLKNLDRSHDFHQNNNVKIRLNVQRSSGKIALFLNDEPEGEFLDEVPARPQAGGLRIEFEGQNDHAQSISDIRITRLDDRVQRHKSEDRGDPKTDALISRTEDRWTGTLERIEPRNGETMFHFRSKFQTDLMEVPASDVSTLFFQHKEAGKDAPKAMCRIETSDGSELMAASCRFGDDRIEFDHPLLGALEIPKSRAAMIKWILPGSGKDSQ